MRVQGWENRLHDHLASRKPFAWGENDCALWCADWVAKATGKDFAADWRGQYSGEDELKARMVEAGFAGTEEIADATDLPRVPSAFAGRGDIVLHPTLGCLGICNGLFSHFLTLSGMTRVGTLRCKKAWKV